MIEYGDYALEVGAAVTGIELLERIIDGSTKHPDKASPLYMLLACGSALGQKVLLEDRNEIHPTSIIYKGRITKVHLSLGSVSYEIMFTIQEDEGGLPVETRRISIREGATISLRFTEPKPIEPAEVFAGLSKHTTDTLRSPWNLAVLATLKRENEYLKRENNRLATAK